MTDYVELRKVIDIMLRWLWLLALVTVVSAATGYAVSQRQPSVYEATTTVMVGEFIQATELSRTDLLTSEVLAQTYADMALRQPVLQAVVDTLDLPYSWRILRKQIQVDLVEGTQLLEVKAEAGSTEQARAIADEVAQQLILLSPTASNTQKEAESRKFVSQRLASLQAKMERAQVRVDNLENTMLRSDSAQQILELETAVNGLQGLISDWESNYIQMLTYMRNESPSNSLTVIEPAQASPTPIRPRTYLNTIIAAAIGFLLSVGLTFLLEFWNNTLKSADDLRQSLGLTALGTIDRIAGKDARSKLVFFQDPASSVTEAYRIVRSNIEFRTDEDPVKSIVVTSSGPGEGKSITVANLGIIMAQAGLHTIIVDADLRQPAQHQLFQMANSRGLAEAIRSPELDLSDLMLDTQEHNLQVLTSGDTPSNPAELLRSEGMRRVLTELRSMADVVICDSPPVLGLTDAGILTNRTDGVVFVIEAGQTRLAAARQALSNLQQADANLIGAILNRGRVEHWKYYAYGGRPAFRGSVASTRLNRLWQWLPF